MLEIGLMIGAWCVVAVAVYPLHCEIKWRVIIGILLWLGIGIGYLYFGNWKAQHQFAVRQKQLKQVSHALQSYKGREGVIQALKARLDHTQHSAKGWYLLGKLYAGEGKWVDSRAAFKEAYHLEPNTEYLVQYAMSRWQCEHQHLTPKTRQLFESILSQNAKQPEALMVLAMDAYLMGHDEKAIQYWQRLLELLPSNSEDARLIRKAIAKAEMRLMQAKQR